jgi:hypothetical protein
VMEDIVIRRLWRSGSKRLVNYTPKHKSFLTPQKIIN